MDWFAVFGMSALVLVLGVVATTRGNRFRALVKLRLHSLHVEGELESSPGEERR
jgi:hypothetical protein